jgi:hypothetical protein
MTILGVLLMVGALIGWVRLEASKLDHQAETLRRAMGPPPPGA